MNFNINYKKCRDLAGGLFLLILGLAGCRKFVELDPPKTLLVSTNAFKSDATANSVLSGMYIQISNQGAIPYRLGVLTALSADELNTNYDVYRTAFVNVLLPVNAPTNDIWSNCYNYIFQANAIYEGCDKSTTLTPAVKKQLMAEARFIRAFWYFYLINLYGDVPLLLTTDYETNGKAGRIAKNTVYDQIVNDLLYAQNNLNDNYLSANSTSPSNERVRPNKNTATAFLARVYLYLGKYADAEIQATAIIDQKDLYSLEAPEKTFLKGSKEAIWQLAMPAPSLMNTTEGQNYILTDVPGTGSSENAFFLPTLKSAFETNDLRFSNWVGLISSGGVDYYYPFKYKVKYSSLITERSIVLRLAEQFLIRAECRVKLNKLATAIEDADVIRKRAGLPLIKDTNPNISQGDLMKAIQKERQTELFCEWGHRWLDLNRTGRIDDVMKAIQSLKSNVWQNTKALWPLPQADIGNDVNLKQNPGYN